MCRCVPGVYVAHVQMCMYVPGVYMHVFQVYCRAQMIKLLKDPCDDTSRKSKGAGRRVLHWSCQ